MPSPKAKTEAATDAFIEFRVRRPFTVFPCKECNTEWISARSVWRWTMNLYDSCIAV
jgi:hypothetical protein